MRATETDLLLFIDEHPNYMQQEIAQKMVIDPSLLARDLRALAQKNYIKRQCDADDRRAKRIRLTRRGQNQVCQLRQVMNNWWQQLFDQHDLDATTVYQTLESVYDAMTNDKNNSNFH